MSDVLNPLTATLDYQAAALQLRSQRAQTLASNLANADTPGYQAKDFDFRSALQQATGTQQLAARAPAAAATALSASRTDARHLAASLGTVAGPDLQFRVPMQTALDGNSVEPDVERAAFVDNSVRYESGLRFMTAQIKTMLSAISGQ